MTTAGVSSAPADRFIGLVPTRSRAIRLVALGQVAVACGLANPLATPIDGSAPPGLRAGIAAASFVGDCEATGDCTVQLSMGHPDFRWHRADVIAVRVVVDGHDLGPVQWNDVRRWQGGAYRAWYSRMMEPYGTTKLSIDVGAVDWTGLLAPLGPGEDHVEHDLHIEVDLAFDDQPVTVRALFPVQREPEADRVFVVT